MKNVVKVGYMLHSSVHQTLKILDGLLETFFTQEYIYTWYNATDMEMMLLLILHTWHPIIRVPTHTLEICKFPTISQLFQSSSITISQPKLHGIHNISEQAKCSTFPFYFSKCPNYFTVHFPDQDIFFVNFHPPWTTLQKFSKFTTYPKSNSKLFPKFPTCVGALNNQPCFSCSASTICVPHFTCFHVFSHLISCAMILWLGLIWKIIW